jgi:O-Antigen ligase
MATSAARIAPARRLAFADGSVTRWMIATAVLLLGYLLLGRAFAYIGLPGMPLFIGEIYLLAFLILQPVPSLGRLTEGLLKRTELSVVCWSMYVLLAYGVILAVRGLLAGYPRNVALQELAFNFYPMYVFIGLWLGGRDEGLLPRFLLLLAWANGIYGVAYFLGLNGIFTTFPGTTDVLIFNKPNGQTIALIALMSFGFERRKIAVPFAMNLFVLLAGQTRAHWAGLLIALPTWAILSRRMGRMITVVGLLVALLAVAWVTDIRVGSEQTGQYSARGIVGAALASFDLELAQQLTDEAESFAGTVEWRKEWWRGIWTSANSDPVLTMVGHGYGFPLSSTAVLSSTPPDLRTPHNWFFWSLGYGGWIGVIAFGFFMWAVARLLWIVYRRTGEAFGISFLILVLVTGLFTNYFETPFAAIPVYVIAGMAAAPALRHDDSGPLSVHGRRRRSSSSNR